MTFSDDHMVLVFPTGERRTVKCVKNNIEWPPPPRLSFAGLTFARESMSQISDHDRADMTHVCRGSLYRVEQ